MSGHSKWHNIQKTKGAADAKRAQAFTKIAREMIVAVKEGGGDPRSNSRLAAVIAKAKAANMPNDNIKRTIDKALGADYDLVILDVMLPGIDGFEVCRQIRKHKECPVLMVSAKKDEIDKIRGLGLGADDYITKPFSPSELVARVTAHISRYERLTSKGEEPVNYIINVGKLSIDTHARRVFVNEKEVTLTNKEFDLLTFLASNPNVVYSKDAIFDKIWGLDAIGETSTVTVHINRIRDKIETDSSNPQYIETVWGAGYRFKA